MGESGTNYGGMCRLLEIREASSSRDNHETVSGEQRRRGDDVCVGEEEILEGGVVPGEKRDETDGSAPCRLITGTVENKGKCEGDDY